MSWGRALFCALVASTYLPTASRAQAVTARHWVSVAAGIGPAEASMRGDTVYEGSGEAFGRIGYAWRASSAYALEAELLGAHPFGAGDCIRGFTVCAPPFNFIGASLNGLLSLGRPAAPDRGLVGAGAGLYRVAPGEGHIVPPRLAPGLQLSVEIPAVVVQQTALTIGIRGFAFPYVHGQALWVAVLTAGFRQW